MKVPGDCRCEWRRTVSFWPLRIRRRWHRCLLVAGHSGPCECKCGRRLAPWPNWQVTP